MFGGVGCVSGGGGCMSKGGGWGLHERGLESHVSCSVLAKSV